MFHQVSEAVITLQLVYNLIQASFVFALDLTTPNIIGCTSIKFLRHPNTNFFLENRLNSSVDRVSTYGVVDPVSVLDQVKPVTLKEKVFVLSHGGQH